MKKLVTILSFFLMAAFVLSACSSAAGTSTSYGPSGGAATNVPSTGVTPEATLPVASTPMATEVMNPTAATGGGQGTPEATAVPGGAATGAQPWQLSSLLTYNAISLDCQPIGKVNSVLLDPTSNQISYIAISSSDTVSPTLTLVPMGAFAFISAEGQPIIPSTGTTTPMTTTASSTPVAGATPVMTSTMAAPASNPMPININCSDQQNVLVVTVDQSALASAPTFKTMPDTTAADWNKDIVTFWSQYVPTLPVTGASAPAPVAFSSMQDLKLVGKGGEILGPVVEVVVNPQSGMLTDIILKPGGLLTLSDRYIAIPIKYVTYDPSSNQFTLTMEVKADQFSQAPSFPNLQAIPDPMQNPNWDQDIQSFWSNVK